MEWNEEAIARLCELWDKGLSTAEIGRHLGVTKNSVVGKAHRLGLEGRPSPIRRASSKQGKLEGASPKESAPKEKKISKPKVEKLQPEVVSSAIKNPQDKKQLDLDASKQKVEVKSKKPKLEFISPADLPRRRSHSECCWPIGDPGTKGFHFCGAPSISGKPYCAEHVQVAYVKLRDRRSNNVA